MTILLDSKIRELVRDAVQTQSILQIILLLSHIELDIHRAGADALSKLSEQGDISSFLT